MKSRLTIAFLFVIGWLNGQNNFKVSSDFPGGNIMVTKISGDTVSVKPDLSFTAGEWFYWYFKISGSLIISLGYCKKEDALPSVVHLAKKLKPESSFSHFRAVAVACEAIGSRHAAPVLFGLLGMDGVRGHAMKSIEEALEMTVPSRTDNPERNASLKEIFLGRSLYKIGDYRGLGRKVMEEYAADLRGPYYRHANGVLSEGLKFDYPDK
ncbi:MAG: hypothetical protein AAGU19_12365 [Prolixibacteraceae bacterium]